MHWILVVDVDNMFCRCEVLLLLEVILGKKIVKLQIESVSRGSHIIIL